MHLRNPDREPVKTAFSFGEGDKKIEGFTFDITQYGVGLVSPASFREGEVHRLVVAAQGVDALAEVRWCSHDGDRYRMGVKLIQE